MQKTPIEGVESRAEFRTIGWEGLLQRLFSTFPDGWPGFALLLLRLGLGLRLVTLAFTGNASEPIPIAQNWIAAAGAVFLLAGLWTPIAGALVALDAVWTALSLASSHRGDVVVPISLAVLCASLAMLGPGAWSIDARLFGRRRLYRDRNRGRRPSS